MGCLIRFFFRWCFCSLDYIIWNTWSEMRFRIFKILFHIFIRMMSFSHIYVTMCISVYPCLHSFSYTYRVTKLIKRTIITHTGQCRCRATNLQIGGVRTGREVAGQPEWKITVVNTCNCPQKQVLLTCRGFAPVNPVKPWLLRPQGNACLLINGEVLPAGATAEFAYVGQIYVFRPVSSMIRRSCMN